MDDRLVTGAAGVLDPGEWHHEEVVVVLVQDVAVDDETGRHVLASADPFALVHREKARVMSLLTHHHRHLGQIVLLQLERLLQRPSHRKHLLVHHLKWTKSFMGYLLIGHEDAGRTGHVYIVLIL